MDTETERRGESESRVERALRRLLADPLFRRDVELLIAWHAERLHLQEDDSP